MATSCLISFDDNPEKICRPGDRVSGSVELAVHRDIKINKVRLTLDGIAQCQWQNEGSAACGNYKRYLHLVTDFMENDNVIKPGNCRYNFSQQLPKELPFSIKEMFGEVTYTATVLVVCTNEDNVMFNCEFTVLPVFDLNEYPQFKVPRTQKTVYGKSFIPFLSSTSILIATLPRSAFVREETINIEAKIINNSKISSGFVSLTTGLYKVVEFYSGKDRTPNKKLKTKITEIVKESSDDLDFFIQLPISTEMLPSSHKKTKVLFVTHYVKIMAKILDRDPLILIFPILVGTIPYSDIPVNIVPMFRSLPPSPTRLRNQLQLPSTLDRIQRRPLPPTRQYLTLPTPDRQNVSPSPIGVPVPSAPSIDDLPPSFEEAMRMSNPTANFREYSPQLSPRH